MSVYIHIYIYTHTNHPQAHLLSAFTHQVRASLSTPTPTAKEHQGQPLSLLQDIRGV